METVIKTLHYAKVVVGAFALKGEPITHLKLQKILYFIQGWHLAYFDNDPFNEMPEAWVHGPVYVSAYNAYREYGYNTIPFESTEDVVFEQLIEGLPDRTENTAEFLNGLLDHYGSKSAFELELLTHNQDPWINARKGLGPIERSARQIELIDISNYFKSQLTH
jgi:uncharacterized phage-associated protein